LLLPLHDYRLVCFTIFQQHTAALPKMCVSAAALAADEAAQTTSALLCAIAHHHICQPQT